MLCTIGTIQTITLLRISVSQSLLVHEWLQHLGLSGFFGAKLVSNAYFKKRKEREREGERDIILYIP